MLPTLETSRLTLRDLNPSDFQNVLELDQDKDVMRYITATGRALKREESIAGFDKLVEFNNANKNLGVWIAETKSAGEFVGLFALKPMNVPNEVEIGFRLRKTAWGKGYATEAGRRLLDYGFTELKLKRIVGVVDSPNTDSIHVLTKLGLTFEKEMEILEHRDNKKIVVRCYAVEKSVE